MATRPDLEMLATVELEMDQVAWELMSAVVPSE
jgi:hypothetical protein